MDRLRLCPQNTRFDPLWRGSKRNCRLDNQMMYNSLYAYNIYNISFLLCLWLYHRLTGWTKNGSPQKFELINPVLLIEILFVCFMSTNLTKKSVTYLKIVLYYVMFSSRVLYKCQTSIAIYTAFKYTACLWDRKFIIAMGDNHKLEIQALLDVQVEFENDAFFEVVR